MWSPEPTQPPPHRRSGGAKKNGLSRKVIREVRLLSQMSREILNKKQWDIQLENVVLVGQGHLKAQLGVEYKFYTTAP